MSAIARVLRGWGKRVQGSDRRDSPLVAALRAEGIPVVIGHAPENIGSAELVLASSAVPDDNVELEAARERGIPVMRRPDFLPLLTEGFDVIAVAGAHGKTTVTGMLALTMLAARLDPTFIVGGVMRNLRTNARAGRSRHFLIEADEYRDTFLALHPLIAVVTNVEFDHPDYFPGLRFVRLSFGNFVANIRPGGLLVACNDDPVAHQVAAAYHAEGGRLVLYGRNEGVGVAWRATDIHPNERGGVTFTVVKDDKPLGEIALRLPGDFNAVNALAVLAVADELGIPLDVTREALAWFEGTARRFEVLGVVNSITVIDDYAHHPTQIRNVLAAAKQRYPGRRIIAAWEPHTFSRPRALMDEFATAFSDADHVVVLPIYAAREADDGTLAPRDLAARLDHPSVDAAATPEAAVALLAAHALPGDVVILMGAGNEYKIGQALLEELRL